MNRLNTFCNFFVDLLLFELHTLENRVFDLNSLRASMRLDNKSFESEKRSPTVFGSIKTLQSLTRSAPILLFMVLIIPSFILWISSELTPS